MIVCGVAALAFVSAAEAQDVLTIGSSTAKVGDSVAIPVSLHDVSSTLLGTGSGSGNALQGLAFKISWDSTQIASVTFARAGITGTLKPLFERATTTSASLSYIVVFDEQSQPVPFTTAAALGDRIGTLTVKIKSGISAGVIAIQCDRAKTVLSNDSGTAFESTYNGQLKIVSGTISVGGNITTTTISASPLPPSLGQPVTLTAVVTSPAGGIPTGTVSFSDHGSPLVIAVLAGGSASSTLTLNPGPHQITASYSGDAGYRSSTTATPLSFTVSTTPAPPSNVNAVATSQTSGLVTWSAVPGADYYQVISYSRTGTTTWGSTSSLSKTITGLSPNSVYAFGVTAYAGGVASAVSARDILSTYVFVDDPLVAGATFVRSAHLGQLRDIVTEIEYATSVSPLTTFSDPTATGFPIRAQHILQLRSALSSVFTNKLGRSAPIFTDSSLVAGTTTIKAVHIQELRELCK